jgi:hypothetical protein
VAAPISRRIGNILDNLWYAASAAETLMVLLALLAVTLGVAGVFPQQPPGLERAAAERWLASSVGNYPGVGQLLSQIGVFAISGSLWLRLLVAALAFSVALRLATQAGILATLVRSRRNPSTLQASGPDEAETAHGKARPSIPATVGPRSPAPLAGLLAYAGALILLAGLFLNSIAGWRATEIALAPGGSSALDRPGAPRLSLEELSGSESNPVARIGLNSKENDEPIGAGLVAAGRPIRRANLWIALRSAGPALKATAKDSHGKPLLLQSLEPNNTGGLGQGEVSEEVHLLFQQTQAEQEFALPSANLSFRVVNYPSLPEQGIEVPVFLVDVYQGDEQAPALSDLVIDSAVLALRGVTLELRRDRYAIVEAAYLPGLIPFSLGGLVMLAGIVLSLCHHPRSNASANSRSPEATPDAETANAA